MTTCEHEQHAISDGVRVQKRKTSMSNQNNRVLVRKGARQLSEEEARNVSGGAVAGTLTLCSIGANGKIDGDLHEC